MKVIASVDDGSHFDLRAAELMDKYGIECIFYIPVEYEMVNSAKYREALLPHEFLELASRYEIGSHTLSHSLLTRLEPEAARWEITRSREVLQEMTGQEINSFCYPRGYYSYQIKQWVEEAGYMSARTVQVGQLSPPEDPYLTHTTVHAGFDRKEYGGLSWFEYGCKMFARATENSLYHLWFHSWEIEKNNDWQDLETLLQVVTA